MNSIEFNSISLNHPETHAIFIGWVRYCLTRRSYAVSECCDILCRRWQELPIETRRIIGRDILLEIEIETRVLERCSKKSASHFDVEIWGDLLSKIKEEAP
jgi:hypothetical protein